MAFPGTELLEVAPTTVGTTCAGGGKVFGIGSGQTAIMDASTSEAYLYTSPGSNNWHRDGYLYVTASGAYSTATSKAWYGTVGYFNYITASGITGSVSSGTSTGNSGYPYYRMLYCNNLATTGDYVWGQWTRSTDLDTYYWARLTISTSSVYYSSVGYSPFPAGGAIGVGGYMYAASGTTVTKYNPSDGTSTGTTYTLPLAAASYPTLEGSTIYWAASSGVVWLDTSSGVTGGVAATPSGLPAPVVRPTILSGVLYWLSSGDKMVAVKLSTGQWKEDTLVTNRANRFGINAASGKLWIPTITTP